MQFQSARQTRCNTHAQSISIAHTRTAVSNVGDGGGQLLGHLRNGNVLLQNGDKLAHGTGLEERLQNLVCNEESKNGTVNTAEIWKH